MRIISQGAYVEILRSVAGLMISLWDLFCLTQKWFWIRNFEGASPGFRAGKFDDVIKMAAIVILENSGELVPIRYL